jgi:hypothetical protein
LSLFDEATDLTQSPDTRWVYTRRCRQLEKAALRALAAARGQPPNTVELTPALFVDYVIGNKGNYAANSWRLVRRSVIWTLEEDATRANEAFANEICTALARLRDEQADPDETREPMTSSTKAKKLPDDDLVMIEQAALATRAKYKTNLVLYFKVGVLTGLRPCEWARAELHRSTREGFAWMLVAANAKATNQRAHGPYRTLYFPDLDPQTVDDIMAWIEIARSPNYGRRLATIGRLLWKITRELWPDSDEWPTLYTTRHVAVAAWKAHYARKGQTDAERLEALATIAAMMGHGSDATASRHYGRANAGRRVVVPAADPEQVARVRRVIDLNWFEALIATSDQNSDHEGQSFSATPSP